MKNKILILLGIFIFMFIPKNVYGANFVEATYDPTISVFDKYGYDINLIANCDRVYSYDPINDTVVQGNASGTKKLCDRNSGLTLTDIKKYFKYYIHVNYRGVSGDERDTYLVFLQRPYIKKEIVGLNTSGETLKGFLVGDNGRTNSLDGMVISNYHNYTSISVNCPNCSPEPVYNISKRFYVCINGNANIGETYLSGFEDWLFNQEIYTFSFMLNQRFDIYSLLHYKELSHWNDEEGLIITVETNFDLLDYEDNSNNYVHGSNSFNFNSDITLNIDYDTYILLVPKKNVPYTPYFWANNVFQYSSFYTINGESYTNNYYRTYNTMLVSTVNEYANWGRWNLSITNEDLQNNVNFQIANQNKDGTLTIKFNSDDFYYSVFDKNTSSVNINGINYSNNYDYIHNNIVNDTVDIQYNYGVDENYFLNIPSLINGFKKSFIFLGTLLTAFFSLITGEMMAYFIILFGFLLIFIVFNILK